MFNIGMREIIIIALVILIAFGISAYFKRDNRGQRE